VFTLMESRLREEKGGSIKQPNVSVLVASAGAGMMKEKMKIARVLWEANISAEFSQQEKTKLAKEIADALEREIPYMVVIGENELAENKCQVKDIKAETADLVPIPDLVAFLRDKGVIPVGCEFAVSVLNHDTPN
jgi:histidyl-tRNA synthetase